MHKSLEAFKAAAATFGLRLEAPEMSWWKDYDLAVLEGTVDGVRVVVQQGVLSVGQTVTRVYFHAAIDPPLDLGLAISLRASGYTKSIPLGENERPGSQLFDAAFTIEAAEPARARALFTPELCASLVRWHNARRVEREQSKNWLEFWVSDESVILRIEPGAFAAGWAKDMPVEEMLADLRASAALAKGVGAAAASVPPSILLAPHAPAWKAFADAHGLAFSPSPLRASGKLGDVPFAARAAHLGKGAYGVELTMPFAQPLPFYLRLGPAARWLDFQKRFAAYPDAWAEWARPHKTGDRAFDEAFRVVTVDEAKQRALLTDDLRAALLALGARHDHVHVTSDCISVRTNAMAPPETWGEVLGPLAELERRIDRARL